MIVRSLLLFFVATLVTVPSLSQVFTAIPIWSPNHLDLSNVVAFEDGTMVRSRRLVWGAKEKYFLLRSTDNGSTWKQVDANHGLVFRYLVKADDVLYALDPWSRPYVSTDKGQSWDPLPLPPGYPADKSIGLRLMSDGRRHAILYSDYGIWRLNSSAPWYSEQIVSSARVGDAKPIMDGTIIVRVGAQYFVVRDGSKQLESWASYEAHFSDTGFTPFALDGQLWLIHQNGDGYVLENGFPILVKRSAGASDRLLAQYVDDDIVLHTNQFYYRDRPDSVFSTHDVVPNGAPIGKFVGSFVAGDRRFLNFEHHVFEITSVKPLVLTERWYSGFPKPLYGTLDLTMHALPNGTLISNNSPQMTSFSTSVDGGLSWHSYSTDSIIREYLTHMTIDQKGTIYTENFGLCSLSADNARSFQATEGPMCTPWMLNYQHYGDGSVTYNDNQQRYYRIRSDRSTVQELPLLKKLYGCIVNPTTIVRTRPEHVQRFELSTDDGVSWQQIATLSIEGELDRTEVVFRRLSERELGVFIIPMDRLIPSTAWIFDVDTRQLRQIYRGMTRPHDIIRISTSSLRLAMENSSIYEAFSDGTSRLHVDPILGVLTRQTESRFRLLHTDGITYMFDQYWYQVIRLGPTLDVTSVSPFDLGNSTHVKLYPNPASSIVTIECGSPIARATVFDLTGTEMMSTLVTSSEAPTSLTMNVSALASGMFILMVYDDKGQAVTSPMTIVR